MARYFEKIEQTLENKTVSLIPKATAYTFRLTHEGTTCRLRGVISQGANTEGANVYTDFTDVEVGNIYKFSERYDSFEISSVSLNAGEGGFVIEQEVSTC